jgi:hypothetical protein
MLTDKYKKKSLIDFAIETLHLALISKPNFKVL